MADGKNGGDHGAGAGIGRLLPLLIGLPLIVIIAAAAVLLSGEGDRPSQSSGQQPLGKKEQASGGGGDAAPSSDATLEHPALGDADAPVVLVEYSDYQ